MSSTHRCIISVAAMISFATIAAVPYSEGAMGQPRDGKAAEASTLDDPVSSADQPAAQGEGDPFGQPADVLSESPFSSAKQPADQANDSPFGPAAGESPPGARTNDFPFGAPTANNCARADDTTPSSPLSRRRAASDLDKQLFRAAQEAYEASLDAFRTGKVTDPEVVYRWSLRVMRAEQAVADDPSAPAAKQHLRRMAELAGLVNRHPSAGSTAGDADNRVQRFAVEFYRREAESWLDTTAQPNDLAPPSHDAAVEAAEAYLGAVLDGNFDKAAYLAVPGSLAASKRLMDTIKGLISNKSISLLAIQTSSRRTSVLMQEARSADNASDDRARAQFTVVLEPNRGRWLVTNISVHKPSSRQNNTLGPLQQPASGRTAPSQAANEFDLFGAQPNAGPKQTKVIILSHAQANDLAKTLGNLNLDSGAADFAIAVDDRTNRIIVRGPSERIAEILALIEQLDVPGPELSTDRGGGPDSTLPPTVPRSIGP
jgi:hypothetical protein